MNVDLSRCGINYCPLLESVDESPQNQSLVDEQDNVDNFSATSNQLYTLAGVYLACSILSAVVVALFVDPLSKYSIVHNYMDTLNA